MENKSIRLGELLKKQQTVVSTAHKRSKILRSIFAHELNPMNRSNVRADSVYLADRLGEWDVVLGGPLVSQRLHLLSITSVSSLNFRSPEVNT